MNILKKLVAVVIVACTALSFTACSDTTWAYKDGDYTVKSGLYLMNLLTAYSSAQTHTDRNADIEDVFKQKLDGKDAKQWMIDEAYEAVAEYFAIEKKFDELGLSFSETDKNIIEQNFKSSWETVSSMFEKNGVGEQSYRLELENRQKRQLIFAKYYDKDGIEAVSDENLIVHFKDNFAAINMFGIKLEQGEDLTEDQIKKNNQAKESADKLIEMMKKGDKTYNEVYMEYIKLQNADLPEDEQKDTTPDKDDETMNVIKKGSEVPTKNVVDTIFNTAKPDGDPILIVDPSGYFLCKRYDVTKQTDKFDEMRAALLGDIKSEDFEKLIKEWVDSTKASMSVNDAAIKRYNPKKIDFTL